MSDRRELLNMLCAAAELDPAESVFGDVVALAPPNGGRAGSGILGGLLSAFKPLLGGRSTSTAGAARSARESDFARAEAAIESAAAVAASLEAELSWVDERLSASTLTSREARNVVFDEAPVLVLRHRLQGLSPHERSKLRAALVRGGEVARVLEELFGGWSEGVVRALETLAQLRAIIEATQAATLAMEDEAFKELVSADPRLGAALRGRIVAARRLERGGRFAAAARSWTVLSEWARCATAVRFKLVQEAAILRLELDELRKAVANDETRRWAKTLAAQLPVERAGDVSTDDGGLAASITSARIALTRSLLDQAAKSHWTEVRKAVASSARLLTAVSSSESREIPELASLKLSPKRSQAMAYTDQLFKSFSGIVETQFSAVRDRDTREHQRALDDLPEGGTYVFPFGEHRGPFVVRRSAAIDGSGSHFWSRRGPVFEVREGHLSLRNVTLESEDRGLRVLASRKATWSIEPNQERDR